MSGNKHKLRVEEVQRKISLKKFKSLMIQSSQKLYELITKKKYLYFISQNIIIVFFNSKKLKYYFFNSLIHRPI